MMLAARNRSGGERPRILAYMRQDLEGFHQKLKDKDTAHIEELLNQRKLAEGFVREHFNDEQGHNIRAYHTSGTGQLRQPPAGAFEGAR